jgi:hypothetical protein
MSLILGGVNATMYAMSTLISFVAIERKGRRFLFFAGSFGQALAMFLTMICLVVGAHAAKGAAVGLFLYIIVFGCTWLELPWLYPAELSPLRTRTRANALSTSTNWIFVSYSLSFTPALT